MLSMFLYTHTHTYVQILSCALGGLSLFLPSSSTFNRHVYTIAMLHYKDEYNASDVFIFIQFFTTTLYATQSWISLPFWFWVLLGNMQSWIRRCFAYSHFSQKHAFNRFNFKFIIISLFIFFIILFWSACITNVYFCDCIELHVSAECSGTDP